jgi:hypothetical protein
MAAWPGLSSPRGNGTEGHGEDGRSGRRDEDEGVELVVLGGAGDRDRTGMTSLEGWGSTIELRPRSGMAGT